MPAEVPCEWNLQPLFFAHRAFLFRAAEYLLQHGFHFTFDSFRASAAQMPSIIPQAAWFRTGRTKRLRIGNGLPSSAGAWAIGE
jgi:hypothetical protein